MPCHINNCQITDASHLMQCSGSCGRSYHAACAGTQRNYENEITNYMIPLCRDCQGVISVEVTTRAVLLQQQKLTCDIKALIDANFKACNAFKQMDNKIEVVQDEYEGIATLLGEMQQQLNRLDKKIDDSTLNVCKKVSSILDDVAPADNASTLVKIDALTSVTQQIGESQSMIGERLKNINTELIFLSGRDPGPAVNEILEEIKAISANLPAGTEQTEAHHETLADELASSSASGSPNLKDNSGWRTLGNKRLWKADWTDYDIRTARRKEQSKLRRKANQRKRRRQHRRSSYTGTDDLDEIDYELDYSFFDNNFHLEQRNDRLHRLCHNQLAQHLVKQPVNLLQTPQHSQSQQQQHQQHNQQQQSQQQQHQQHIQLQQQQSQQRQHQPQQHQHQQQHQQHSQHQQQQSQQRQHQPQQHQHQSQQQQQLHQLQQPYQDQQQQQQHQQLQQPSLQQHQQQTFQHLQQPQQAHPLQQQQQQQHQQQQPQPHQQHHQNLQQQLQAQSHQQQQPQLHQQHPPAQQQPQLHQQQQPTQAQLIHRSAQVYSETPSWMFRPAQRSSFSETGNFMN